MEIVVKDWIGGGGGLSTHSEQSDGIDGKFIVFAVTHDCGDRIQLKWQKVLRDLQWVRR